MLRGKVTVGQRLFYTVFHLLSGLLELHGLQFFCNGFCLFSGRLFAFLGVDRLEHLSDLLYLGLVSTTDALGNTTAFAYDGADNLTSVTFADGTFFAYEYDKVGNLTSQTDALGNVTTFQYDALRQLVKTTYPDGSEATGSYDASGNLISATDAGGNTTTAEYDAVGRLLAVTDALGNTTAYEYDRTGQLTAETLANGGKTHYNYDNMGRVTRIVTATGEQTSYTYDAADNILTVTAPDGGVTAYTYDAMGRLLTETAPNGAVTRYTYDLAGNLSTVTDAKGSVTATRYAYNALNLLQSYTGEDGYTETYTYNADRLLSSVTTPEATTNLTWDILYGDGVVISETTGKNTTNYTYGLERISTITGSNRTEYIYDARGSVAAEVSYNNAWYTFGGMLAWKNVTSKSYTPFGEQIGETVSGFGYNGEYYNAATGMVYLRARFYEPEMNRFSQKDVLRGDAVNPVSLNRYAYVQNDPVNFVDPSGMSISSITNAVRKMAAKVTISSVNRVTNAIKSVKIAKRTTIKKYVRKPQTTTVLPTKNKTSSIDSGGAALERRVATTQQGSNNVKNTTSPGGKSHYTEKATTLSTSKPTVQSVSSMQTSCTSSPIEQGVTQFRDYLIEAKNEKYDGTLTIGVNLSAGFGAGLGINAGLGVDRNGNVGIIAGYTTGAAMPSASAVGYISISNASSIRTLSGDSIVTGASGGEVVVVGGEVAMFPDSGKTGKNKVSVSGAVQAGVGVGIPVEIHGMYANSEVASVNLYDILISICDLILQ